MACKPINIDHIGIINQHRSPTCALIAIANIVSARLEIPINVNKFIACLPLYNSNDEIINKQIENITNETHKLLTKKFLGFLSNNEKHPIKIHIDYDRVCNSAILVDIFDDVHEEECDEDCSISYVFDVIGTKDNSVRNLYSIACAGYAFSLDLKRKHIKWLQSLPKLPYDPNNIPLYNPSEDNDLTNYKDVTIQVFKKPTDLSVLQARIKNNEIDPSLFTCSENHGLQPGDNVLLELTKLPWPLNIENSSAGEIVLVIDSVPSSNTFYAYHERGIYYPNIIYSANKKLSLFTSDDDTEIQGKFIKASSFGHAVTVVDVEYNPNTRLYTFTLINSWGDEKSYKTRLAVDRNYVISNFYANRSLNSPIVAIKPVKKLLNIKSDSNWTLYEDEPDREYACGFCKYLCEEFGYALPPNFNEDQYLNTAPYNLKCLEEGFNTLVYNSKFPHKCHCINSPSTSSSSSSSSSSLYSSSSSSESSIYILTNIQHVDWETPQSINATFTKFFNNNINTYYDTSPKIIPITSCLNSSSSSAHDGSSSSSINNYCIHCDTTNDNNDCPPGFDCVLINPDDTNLFNSIGCCEPRLVDNSVVRVITDLEFNENGLVANQKIIEVLSSIDLEPIIISTTDCDTSYSSSSSSSSSEFVEPGNGSVVITNINLTNSGLIFSRKFITIPNWLPYHPIYVTNKNISEIYNCTN